LWFFNVA
jgi:hypothetical protein